MRSSNGSLALAPRRGEQVGFGLGFFVEKSGLGPFDDAKVLLEADGGIEVVTGAASVGQGIETALAQICAEALGVLPEAIRVTHGQDRPDRGRHGRVRLARHGHDRLRRASRRDRPQAQAPGGGGPAAAEPTPAGISRSRAGRIRRGDGQGPSLGLADLARVGGLGGPRARPADRRARPQQEVVLSADARFTSAHMTYPYGIMAVVVRVDAETGGLAIERLWVAYDVGRAVNPMLIEAQIAGGALQGIGGALLEEFVYDAARPAAGGELRRLSDARPRRRAAGRGVADGKRAEPAQSARRQGRGRGRHQRGRRRDRRRDRRALAMPGAVDRLPVTSERLYRLARRCLSRSRLTRSPGRAGSPRRQA